ncbi:hypothetical protein J7L87_03475, partial [bacterium]|nr:hypothetical protein [bacterium]
MRKVLILFSFFSILCYGGKLPEEKNIIVIPKCKKPPVIDGKISPGEWNRAVAITGFQHIFGWMTSRQVVVYITYDEERIYFAFRSIFPKGSKLRRAARERDHKRLCADDTIEIYIAPDYEKLSSLDYHFLGNSLGVIQDFEARPNIGNVLLGWNGNWEFKNTTGPGWWEAEVSIKLDEVKLKEGKYFGINVCRDYAKYIFTNWTIGGYRNYAKAILKKDCPSIQLVNLGKVLQADMNARIKIYGGKTDTTLKFMFSVESADEGKILKKIEREVKLKGNEEREIQIPMNWRDKAGKIERIVLKPGEPQIASRISKNRKLLRMKVIDEKSGEVLLYHNLLVKEGVEDYVETGKQRVFEVFADFYPSYGVVKASADIYDFEKKKEVKKISVYIKKKEGEEIYGCGIIDKFKLGYGETNIKHLPMENGKYEVVFLVLDKNGNILAKEKTEMEKKSFEWENTHYGVSDEVIPPFTPLKVKGKSVFCWGREYKFGNTGFPEKIITRKQNILKKPVSLFIETENKKLKFSPFTSLQTLSVKEGIVKLRGYGKAGMVRIENNIEIEYDGMIKYKLKIIPDMEIKVKHLYLDIPLRKENAILYHACGESIRLTNKAGYIPEGKGKVWGSSEIPNSIVLGTFIPYFWIGDYDRGICWMADNDKRWITDDKKDCIEFIREKGMIIARINFFNKEKSIREPREIVFAIMAGPPRPEPKGWRIPQLSKRWSSWFCGVPTFQGYGKPPDMERYLKWAKEMKKKRGYWGVNMSPNDLWGRTEENLYYEVEWSPGVPTYKRNDYVMYNLNKLMDMGLIDGLYSDDVYPVADRDIITGRGYIREDGKVQAGYSMFALRDFYKRSAYLFRKHKCQRSMMVHMTDSMIMPAYCFWDIKHDNEWGRTYNVIEAYPLGEICARSMGRQ